MAASGYTPISLYYSTTASAVPTAGNLANGELALNIADMKLYAKNSAGTVTLLASNASTTGVDSLSFGSTGLTPSTATTGAITVAGTLATTNGGTGLTSFTANGVLYASSTSALTSGSALTFNGTGVGIGVASAASLLDVFGSGTLEVARFGTTTDSTPSIAIYSNGAIRAKLRASTAETALLTQGNLPLLFGINDTEQMRLTSTGLGIGLGGSSPSARLQVSASATPAIISNTGTGGNYQSALSLRSTSSSYGAGIQFYDGTNDGYISWYSQSLYFAGTGGATRLIINASGAFGLNGANYGTSGQVLTSAGSGAAPTWSTPTGISTGKSIAMAMIFGF